MQHDDVISCTQRLYICHNNRPDYTYAFGVFFTPKGLLYASTLFFKFHTRKWIFKKKFFFLKTWFRNARSTNNFEVIDKRTNQAILFWINPMRCCNWGPITIISGILTSCIKSGNVTFHRLFKKMASKRPAMESLKDSPKIKRNKYKQSYLDKYSKIPGIKPSKLGPKYAWCDYASVMCQFHMLVSTTLIVIERK